MTLVEQKLKGKTHTMQRSSKTAIWSVPCIIVACLLIGSCAPTATPMAASPTTPLPPTATPATAPPTATSATAVEQAPKQTLVRLEPESAQVDVGGTVTVAVQIENVSSMYGADVRLDFDEEYLSVADANPSQPGIQVAHGDFLAPDFVIRNTVDPDEGTIWYAIVQRNDLHPDPVNGSGVLARIAFHGDSETAGASSVDFTYHKLTQKEGGTTIPSTAQGGEIVVGAGAAQIPLAYLPLLLHRGYN